MVILDFADWGLFAKVNAREKIETGYSRKCEAEPRNFYLHEEEENKLK